MHLTDLLYIPIVLCIVGGELRSIAMRQTPSRFPPDDAPLPWTSITCSDPPGLRAGGQWCHYPLIVCGRVWRPLPASSMSACVYMDSAGYDAPLTRVLTSFPVLAWIASLPGTRTPM